jgi:HK97 family phage prohead protease
MTQELSYKNISAPIEVPDEKGFVEGYASVYGVVDSQNDVVDIGAFNAVLRDPSKVKFLWQHDFKKPTGRILKLWEDEIGLKYRAKYNLKTSWGKDAYEAAVNGDIDSNSIGYNVKAGKAFKDDDGTQHLSIVDLWEISNVTFPSNPEAVNTSVKGLGDKPEAPDGEKAGRVLSTVNSDDFTALRDTLAQALKYCDAILGRAAPPADAQAAPPAKAPPAKAEDAQLDVKVDEQLKLKLTELIEALKIEN